MAGANLPEKCLSLCEIGARSRAQTHTRQKHCMIITDSFHSRVENPVAKAVDSLSLNTCIPASFPHCCRCTRHRYYRSEHLHLCQNSTLT